MKDLEYIVNGTIVEDESKAEQDEARKKRMLALIIYLFSIQTMTRSIH